MTGKLVSETSMLLSLKTVGQTVGGLPYKCTNELTPQDPECVLKG